MARLSVTTADIRRYSGRQTDDFYSSQARGADDGVEWQMEVVDGEGKCSLLPSSPVKIKTIGVT